LNSALNADFGTIVKAHALIAFPPYQVGLDPHHLVGDWEYWFDSKLRIEGEEAK